MWVAKWQIINKFMAYGNEIDLFSVVNRFYFIVQLIVKNLKVSRKFFAQYPIPSDKLLQLNRNWFKSRLESAVNHSHRTNKRVRIYS